MTNIRASPKNNALRADGTCFYLFGSVWLGCRPLNPEIGVFAIFTTITRRPSLRTKAFGFDDLIAQRPRVTSPIAGLASTIRRWVARSQQRRALREIAERNDHHLLKDIGVSQEEAFREADKPFWRR